MTPDGLKEAAEVLEAVMKYDMPNSIYQQFTEAAHTLAQIYQGLQAEVRLYSGRYGAGRELHTKWEIHWNKNEQEKKDWNDVKYREVLKNREDVQSARRHVMQTTGMTEEEIVQRARTSSRKRRWSSSSIAVPTMEVEEQPVTSAPPMRTYYQRPGFANRSAAAADWLSGVSILNETGTIPAPTEASQMPQTTADSTALIESGGWVSAEDAATAAAIQYALQQTLGAPRMTYAQWVRFAHSLRWAQTITNGPVPPVAQLNHNQWGMNVRAHPTAPSPGVRIFSEQAVTAMNGQLPQAMEPENGTVTRQTQQPTSGAPNPAWSFVPSPDVAGRAALERLANWFPLIEDAPLFPVGSAFTAALTAANSTIPSEGQEIRAGAVNLASRGTARRVRNGRSSLARNRDVELPSWARPGSQARADDAAILARNAAVRDDQSPHLSNSFVAISSNTAGRSEEQDGRTRAAALIRSADMMRRSRLANSRQQDLARVYHAAIPERNAGMHNNQRAYSTASLVATTSTILPSSDEHNGSTAAGAVNMMWQPWLAANPQPSLARPDDAAVRERNAAAHDDHGAHSTASPSVTTSNAAFHYEVQDGRAASAATIRAADSMRRARVAADTLQNLTRAIDTAVRESDTALLERYRSVLAEEEQEIRSRGTTLLERRADRRRANGQRAPPRALDVAVMEYLGQQGRARMDGTVTRRWQRAGRGRSVFNSNASSETDEDAFWWQGSQ